jgi:hypothetical protein
MMNAMLLNWVNNGGGLRKVGFVEERKLESFSVDIVDSKVTIGGVVEMQRKHENYGMWVIKIEIHGIAVISFEKSGMRVICPKNRQH